MAEHLIEYLQSALAHAVDGYATFQWMSDEETAAIEEPDESAFTLQPWIDAQDDIDPGICARFGERSLFLRGMLVADTDEATAEIQLAPSPELQLVADARRLGVGYILARSTHGGARSARNNVLQASVGTFEEEIDEEGIHLFSACTYGAALRRLAEWALPDADHDGAEMRTRVPADRWQTWLVNELGVDVRTVEINLFLPGHGGDLTAETWMLAHGFGAAVLAVPETDELHVTSITVRRLEDRLHDRVASSLNVTIG